MTETDGKHVAKLDEQLIRETAIADMERVMEMAWAAGLEIATRGSEYDKLSEERKFLTAPLYGAISSKFDEMWTPHIQYIHRLSATYDDLMEAFSRTGKRPERLINAHFITKVDYDFSNVGEGLIHLVKHTEEGQQLRFTYPIESSSFVPADINTDLAPVLGNLGLNRSLPAEVYVFLLHRIGQLTAVPDWDNDDGTFHHHVTYPERGTGIKKVHENGSEWLYFPEGFVARTGDIVVEDGKHRLVPLERIEAWDFTKWWDFDVAHIVDNTAREMTFISENTTRVYSTYPSVQESLCFPEWDGMEDDLEEW